MLFTARISKWHKATNAGAHLYTLTSLRMPIVVSTVSLLARGQLRLTPLIALFDLPTLSASVEVVGSCRALLALVPSPHASASSRRAADRMVR